MMNFNRGEETITTLNSRLKRYCNENARGQRGVCGMGNVLTGIRRRLETFSPAGRGENNVSHDPKL